MLTTLTDSETDSILLSQIIGHLGCSANGEQYVLPLFYIYHNDALYGHTYEGKKSEILKKNKQVCFQVEELIKDGWKSAMVWGMYDQIQGKEATEAIAIMLDRLAALPEDRKQFFPFYQNEGSFAFRKDGTMPVIWKITIEKKSGKAEKR